MLKDKAKLPPGLAVDKRPGGSLLGNRLVLAQKGRGQSLEQVIRRYNDMPDVEYAEYNFIYNRTVVPDDPGYPELWGMAMIQAPQAWDMFTGSATSDTGLVCGIDTGVDMTHPDLASNMLRVYDATTNSLITNDDHGHGTHTMGTIMGVGNNADGVAGVNWRGRGIACKFLTATGSGNTADAVECLDWCVQQGAKISSNSWGGGGFSQSLYDMIAAAQYMGHLFIAAAGNDALSTDSTPHYPSSYDLINVMSIASSTSTDDLSYFSNFGSGATTGTDLAAPGSGILSTLPGNSYAR